MKQVIFINEPNEQEEKPVEFTHYLTRLQGWMKAESYPSAYEKVVYLGRCNYDGDMFAAYYVGGEIIIFKGHLNSGKY